MILRPDLPKTVDEVSKKNNKNTLNSFFPLRTKNNEFDWDAVLGHVVKISYRKSLGNGGLEEFTQLCRTRFLAKLDEEDFWPVIEQMYFECDDFFDIAPELLLFKAQKVKGSSPNDRLGAMFVSLLQDFFFKDKPKIPLNFLEGEIYNAFNEYLNTVKSKASAATATEYPYLPFLTGHFQQDLTFLGKRPKYFLTVFKDFLRLYSFLYTSQLAMNLKDWRSGEPKAKPLYFILDNEKASDERMMVKECGYKPMGDAFWNIFPYLAMNEGLQESKAKKRPIWDIANHLREAPQTAELLKDYAVAFKEQRELQRPLATSGDPLDSLNDLLKLSTDQFARAETRHEINVKYVRTIETELCSHFIQSRGRAGRVLVFNQDYLVLLTNLAIGELDRLRFNELIKAFESRGVFFDKQSQQVLIEFYGRIGNVERMSDSGDAVYVIKTI
ncbi:DNA phosphorothioation-dependent restriction protein DptG [Thalassomonas haliotis]|uniref:DNA phosphorothioation-dependent restriction protein DptG n=1 Tax=Thalassomonas haliotis TaxID=485448 RepID=A0ABY7VJ12_9GAMM|nr:DNA phosphorothioation-dependent restriction protein DptG [Thalassomonas haliotis]WDE13485.1 DNA phosphorothioation-dependent restriction protein DptG [Thalassomonas haliotis]